MAATPRFLGPVQTGPRKSGDGAWRPPPTTSRASQSPAPSTPRTGGSWPSPETTFGAGPPIGGRLAHPAVARIWEDLLLRHPSAFATRVIFKGGHRLYFKSSHRAPSPGTSGAPASPLRPSPLRDSARSMDPTELAFMDQEVPRMLREEIIEPSPSTRLPGTAPRAGASVFSVSKPNTPDRRFILNCKETNALLDCPTFKMSTLQVILPQLRRNDWFTSIDLTSAFSFVPLHPATRPLLSFMFRGRSYQFKALPFGLNSAPHTFTEMLKPVLAHMTTVFPGLRAWAFIDDFLLAHRSRAVAAAATTELLDLLSNLGFRVNAKKSRPTPSQVVTFLGFILRSKDMTVSLPSKKKSTIRAQVRSWIKASSSSAPLPSQRTLASLVGTLNSIRPAFPLALLRSGSLQADRIAAGALRGPAWDKPMPALSAAAIAELHFWDALLSSTGSIRAPMQPPPPTVILETDASFTGGGWVTRRAPPGTTSTSIPHDRESLPITAEGGWFWPHEVRAASRSICDLETLAVTWALLSASPHLRGESILLLCDNFATTRYVEKGRGKVALLRQLTVDLQDVIAATGVRHLSALHLAGRLNRDADRLSRAAPDPTDWKLDPAVFERAARRWGRPQVDLFASQANKQTPAFFSRGLAPGSLGPDAFHAPWTGLCWANPPYEHRLIARLLDKVIREKARLIVCLPVWPSAPWSATLAALTSDSFVIPRGRQMLFRPGHLGSVEPSGPSRWDTVIALISGANWRTRGLSHRPRSSRH